MRRARPPAPDGLERKLGLAAVLRRAGVADGDVHRIGPYEVLGKIGEGGMGVVFKARHPGDGRLVAIKVLRRADARDLARFDREVELIRSLVHPRIVAYLDEGITVDDERYLVMEWLAGHPASERVEQGPLPAADALTIVRAAAEGLAHAHAAGVVHRDLKPSNIFLVDDDPAKTKLIDFGVARFAGHTMTSTGALLGTPAYMAPEQIEGKTSEATDIYGLGVTLFKLLTGQLPFRADNAGAMLVEILRGRAPRICSVRQDLPASFGALVDSMMHREPTARPASMGDLLLELADAASSVRDAVSPPRESVPRPQPILGDDATVRAIEPSSTALVGRRRELGRASGALEAAAEDGTAALLLVAGEAGSGKSRVVDRLLEERSLTPVRIRVDEGRSAAPYEVARGWVSRCRAAGERGDELDALEASFERVATLNGVGRDPAMLADQIRVAWSRWIEACTTLTPLFIDGADRADRVSLRLLSMALAHRRESSWIVVVTAREPEALEWLVREHARDAAVAERVALGPIAPRPLRRLAAMLRGDLSAEVLADAVEGSGGNPARLRVRLLGRREWVGTLAAAEQRVLAMASFVRPMPVELLRTLLGFEPGHKAWRRTLERLVALGAIRIDGTGPTRRILIDAHHEALRARSCLSAAEQVEAHAAVADWMATRGHVGPSVVAGHLEAAGRLHEAAGAWLAASRQALAAAEPDLAHAWAERGLGLANDPSLRGDLEFSRAEGALGQGRLEVASVASTHALDLASPRTVLWYERMAMSIRVSGQLGQHDAVVSQARILLANAGAEENRSAQVLALARAATQLAAAGDPLLEAVDAALQQAAAPGGLSASARAAVSSRRGAFSTRATASMLQHLTDAYEACLEAGDIRTATVQQLYLCSGSCFLGLLHDARKIGEEGAANARRLGDRVLSQWAQLSLGKVFVEEAPLRAIEMLIDVGTSEDATPRIRAGAWLNAGMAHQRLERPAAAIEAAHEATALHEGREIRAAALAIRIRAHLSVGEVEAAAALGDAIRAAANGELMIELGRLIRLAIAELSVATRDGRAPHEVRAAHDVVRHAVDSMQTAVARAAAARGHHLARAILELPPASALTS